MTARPAAIRANFFIEFSLEVKYFSQLVFLNCKLDSHRVFKRNATPSNQRSPGVGVRHPTYCMYSFLEAPTSSAVDQTGLATNSVLADTTSPPPDGVKVRVTT